MQTSKNFSKVMGNKLTFSIMLGFSECSAVGEIVLVGQSTKRGEISF